MADKKFDFRKAIDQNAQVSDLSNLANSGVKKVKVLDEATLLQMIESAVDQVITTQTAAERSKILADSRRQLTQLMNERDQIAAGARSAEATRGELIQQIELLRQELETARREGGDGRKLAALQADNQYLRENNDRMVEELDRLQTENRRLREENDALRAELEALRAKAAEADRARADLDAVRQELEDARAAGATAVAAVRKELDRVRAGSDASAEELETLRARAVAAEEELKDVNESAKTAIQNARHEAERLRGEVERSQAEVARLEETAKASREAAEEWIRQAREEAAGLKPEPEPEPVLEEVPVPTVIPVSEETPPAPEPEPVPATPAPSASTPVLPEGVKPGKGLDVGTVNLVSAAQTAGGDVEIRTQRNVFIDVEITPYTKGMLTRLNVPYVVQAKRMYILGEPAFQLANVLNRRTRRPMKDGLISPREQDALPVMKMLIGSILGEPRAVQEVCFYSVPGDPVDSDLSVAYHRDLFDAVLKSLGYKPSHILEGHAVTFAELAEEDFTGIGISCGGGMFNVCVAYKSMPALTFSTARSGDWVDLNVAAALGIKPEKAAMLKEQGVDLMAPRNREEDAIAIYYRNLIKYNVTNIAERFRSAENMPTFNDPVPIVFSGGTAKAGNFIELVKDVFKTVDFPLPVKEIRLAKDALNATAKGALVAAQLEMAAKPS